MGGKFSALGTAVVIGVVLAMGFLGWLRPVDEALHDFRSAAADRPPTGRVVVVDIDAESLEKVGVWPWPRRLYAEVVDRLMELGAEQVALDIDFSATSTDADDTALEQALARAGGYVSLAAFRQLPQDEASSFNLPLPRFRQYAPAVLVNVGIDRDGVVRSYPYGAVLDGIEIPSLASDFSRVPGPPEGQFLIDFSIAAREIGRIPIARVIDGDLDAAEVAGKLIVIGASALELRDIFIVPGAGPIPGAVVQALATETLLQKRALIPLGPLPGLVVVGAFGLLALYLRGRISLRAGLGLAVLVSGLVEFGAYLLQARWALLTDTAVMHLAELGLFVQAVAFEFGLKQHLHRKVSHERDAARSILDQVIADNFDGVVVIGQGGTIIAASRLAEEILGEGLIGRDSGEVLPREIDRGVVRLFGEDRPQERAATAELLLPVSGQPVRIIEYALTRSEVTELRSGQRAVRTRVVCLTFRDVTERRRNEERLTYLVSHDPMTGAWSRLKLIEMIETLMGSDRGRANGVSVIIIDLGRFKTVNDTLGHSYGDMVLKQVVGRLKACDIDAVARLGGDSFALAAPGLLGEEALLAFCRGVIERVTEPYSLGDHQAIIAASAGATISERSGYDAEVLLSHADMALSAAKRIPGSHVAIFHPEMDTRLKSKRDMELALRRAIERDELTLTYQPQHDLESGALTGLEALVRWNHPQLGPVPPGRFIPSAEETGQIVDIGRWVLREACREAAPWPGSVRIAVNVSPIQFELTDVVGEVKDALRESGLACERLDIEITEGLFMSYSPEITEALQALRAMGIGIALDDFGTGYSSLSYLGRLPVDKIKIDQSFVRSLPANQESGAIIRAVMTLSDTLDKVVIAEGVENADQAWMLRILGCRIGQGYHFGRPKTAAEVMDMLAGEALRQRPMAG